MTVEQLITQLQELVHPNDRARTIVEFHYDAKVFNDDGDEIDTTEEVIQFDEPTYDKQHGRIIISE